MTPHSVLQSLMESFSSLFYCPAATTLFLLSLTGVIFHPQLAVKLAVHRVNVKLTQLDSG